MPINYKDYPHDWKEIRIEILLRANNRCELCNAENYRPHWKTGSKVILTIAHIDQNKKNNKRYNLLALCQRCHLKIDLPYKIKKRSSGLHDIEEWVKQEKDKKEKSEQDWLKWYEKNKNVGNVQ